MLNKKLTQMTYGDIPKILLKELNPRIIYEINKEIDWDMVSITAPSTSFLIYYADYINWKELTLVDKRIKNPDFLELFKGYVAWDVISVRCQFTKKFLRKYLHLFDHEKLMCRKDLTPAMKRMCIDYINFDQQYKELISVERYDYHYEHEDM